MKSVLLIGLLAAALTGCAPPPGGYRTPLDNLRDTSLDAVRGYAQVVKAELSRAPASKVIEMAKQSLADTLKDPSSAQFREVRLVEYVDGVVVCGQVNGKNSYGGYVGFKDFVASTSSSHIRSTGSRYPDIDAAANTGLSAACSGKTYVPASFSS